MPLNSERLCHRPVAGEHPPAVAVAPDLRVPLRPTFQGGSYRLLPTPPRPTVTRPGFASRGRSGTDAVGAAGSGSGDPVGRMHCGRPGARARLEVPQDEQGLSP